MAKPRALRHDVPQPLDQSIKLIALTQNQIAVVDADDYERLKDYNWYAHRGPETGKFYAIRKNAGIRFPRIIHMHRAVLNVDHEVDHRNGDTLDNRKCNLRTCTTSQNHANKAVRKDSKSGFKCVVFRWKGWEAYISFQGKRRYLGMFRTPEEAARAYDKAAKELYGEFAHLNFP